MTLGRACTLLKEYKTAILILKKGLEIAWDKCDKELEFKIYD